MMRRHDPTLRGQAHTLEAVVASLVLISGLLLALQMTTVTPLSASTSSQFIENQQRSAAEGALVAAREVGWLEQSVLYWDDSKAQYHGDKKDPGYTGNQLPGKNRLGRILDSTFESDSVAYNVYFVYEKGGDLTRRRYVYSGTPTDKAVSASRTVTVNDGDNLVNEDGTENPTTVSAATSFYVTDGYSTELYRVITVQVVAWKN